jgi:hypothetical protein
MIPLWFGGVGDTGQRPYRDRLMFFCLETGLVRHRGEALSRRAEPFWREKHREDIKHTMRLGRGQGDRGTAGFRGSTETTSLIEAYSNLIA